MAFPISDFAQAFQRVIEATQVLTDARANFTAANAESYLNQEGVIQQDGVYFDNDTDTGFKNGLAQTRANYAASISSAQQMLNWCLIQLSRYMGSPQTSGLAVLPILYDYMALGQGGTETPARINSRNISYGSWSAGGSNTGNGTIFQLDVDRYGLPLESGITETLTFLCQQDAQSGTNPGQEVFQATGLPVRDALQRYQPGFGSGLQLPITGISADNTASVFQNPSFSQGSGTGPTFVLNNWTIVSGAANLSINTTYYYRASAVEGATPGSLAATGSFQITQQLKQGQSLGALLAYLAQLAVNFSQGGQTGSMQVAIGNLSWTLNSGASGWIASQPALNDDLYFYNFNVAGLAVTITYTATGSGFALFDDFLFSPWTNLGGFQYGAVGGATNWRYYDRGTVANTEGTPAKIQRELSESFGWCLPAAIPSAGGAAPTVTPASSGAVTVGYHAFAYTYFNGATGVESALSAITYAAFVSGTQTADLTGVTTGPTGTTARKIYMTRATSPTAQPVFYYAASIANNSGTSVNVSVADASLLLGCGTINDSAN